MYYFKDLRSISPVDDFRDMYHQDNVGDLIFESGQKALFVMGPNIAAMSYLFTMITILIPFTV